MSDHFADVGKMVPDDVPGEWMEAADRVLVPGKPMTTSDLRKALAAVAPMIAAAERERCAHAINCIETEYNHEYGRALHYNQQKPAVWKIREEVAAACAAAIRALGDAT